MGEKYKRDPAYAQCVDMMEAMIHNNQFTPSEMREMAVLASIHYESKVVRPQFIKVNSEAVRALNTLEEIRTNCPPLCSDCMSLHHHNEPCKESGL